MAKSSVWSLFLGETTNRNINRNVSYVHGVNPSLSKHVLKTHFTYDVDTDSLMMIRDMSRFDVNPKEVPEAFMDSTFHFVDDKGKVIKTNYYTIRHSMRAYATSTKKLKASKPAKRSLCSAFRFSGSSCGFSF